MAELVQKKGWLKYKILQYDLGINGTDNTVLAEGQPIYIKAGCEKVYSGDNNTYIVLGRDRPGPQSSGYGGLGASHAGAISIVAGRQGQAAADVDDKERTLYSDPDQRTDAAFLYISQKTNIDENLGLKPLVTDKLLNRYATGWAQSEAKSGIVLKADNLRMVARQKIKLVTGTDNKLSTGADSLVSYGIDLIAGNDPADLQPIVKGDNLKNCLLDLKNELAKLSGAVAGFAKYQLDFNRATLNHYHITTWPLGPTSKVNITPGDPLANTGAGLNQKITSRTITTLKNQRSNLENIETTYLQRGHAKDGKTKYINSIYNTVN